MPDLRCENAVTAVPPSATQAAFGRLGTGDEVDQQVPRAVSVAPPSDVMVAPSTAEVSVMLADDGEVNTGAAAGVVNDNS